MPNQIDSYWNHTGKYQKLIEKLHARVPLSGSVTNPEKNPKLDLFRRAQNVYYDLYNNGLGNRRSEFPRVFGFGATKYRFNGRFGYEYSAVLYRKVEDRFNEIILEAGIEQGLI